MLDPLRPSPPYPEVDMRSKTATEKKKIKYVAPMLVVRELYIWALGIPAATSGT
jgi:hypothetical protein